MIIDVREQAEFKDGHIPYTINLPSTQFTAEDYLGWARLEIYLVSHSGERAGQTAQKLKDAGLERVFVLDRHMEQIDTETNLEV